MRNQFEFRHHKYTWSNPYGSPRHNWELVGPNGAIHFHATETKDYGVSCGLEFHHLSDPCNEGAPHHLNCPLTGGRCWHDGTSLYAEESVWPTVKIFLEGGNHEMVFALLQTEYRKRFNKETQDD